MLVRYDFRIKRMFGWSLHPDVCLSYCFVCVCVYVYVCVCVVMSNIASYQMSLHSEFCVVMSVTTSPYKRCLVGFSLQLFIGGLMSYLCYLFLFAYRGVQHILCCVFV